MDPAAGMNDDIGEGWGGDLFGRVDIYDVLIDVSSYWLEYIR